MNFLCDARYLIECRGYTPERAIKGEKNSLNSQHTCISDFALAGWWTIEPKMQIVVIRFSYKTGNNSRIAN